MFKRILRKLAGIRNFFTSEIVYLEYSDLENDYVPQIIGYDNNAAVKEMAYIVIHEAERYVKIFTGSQFDKLQREVGSSLGRKKVLETDAFLHPTELLKILHKGTIDGSEAYIIEYEGRVDDRLALEGKNLVHCSEWDEEINRHRKIRLFTGAMNR